MPLLTFTIRRLVSAIVLFFVFTYVLWFLGTSSGFPMLHQLGLGTFFSPGYLNWLTHILHGDFGRASRWNYTVMQIFQMALLPSALVIIPAFLLQQVIAIPIGAFVAGRKGGLLDRIISNGMFMFTALPPFWLALMAIVYICVGLGLFTFDGIIDIAKSLTGFNTPAYWAYFGAHPIEAILDLANHLTLPILIVAFVGATADGQYVRLSMLEVLNQDYIRVAKASGLPRRRIIWKHAFRNALLPIITNIGQQLPLLIIASSITEYIFGIPGFGQFFIRAIYSPPNGNTGVQRPPDLAVITGYVFLIGVLSLLSSIITDIAYAAADPRIRASS